MKITTYKQLITAQQLIFTLFLCVVLIIYEYLFSEDAFDVENLYFVLKFSAVVALLTIIPAITLHLRYFYLNHSSSMEITKGRIYYKNGSSTKTFSISEIKDIELVVTISEFYCGFRSFPTERYFYGVVKFNSGEKIIITTLMDPYLSSLKNLAPEVTSRRKVFFCWV